MKCTLNNYSGFPKIVTEVKFLNLNGVIESKDLPRKINGFVLKNIPQMTMLGAGYIQS